MSEVIVDGQAFEHKGATMWKVEKNYAMLNERKVPKDAYSEASVVDLANKFSHLENFDLDSLYLLGAFISQVMTYGISTSW